MHTQKISAVICILDQRSRRRRLSDTAQDMWKWRGNGSSSLPPYWPTSSSVCFVDWQQESPESCSGYCCGSEAGREDWAFIHPHICSGLRLPLIFPPYCPSAARRLRNVGNLSWIIEDGGVPWDRDTDGVLSSSSGSASSCSGSRASNLLI